MKGTSMTDAVDLSAGPAALPDESARTTPATNRRTMAVVFAAGLALIVLRAPATYELLSTNVPPEMSAQIEDARLEGLALKAAVLAGVVVTAFALAVFLLVAAKLESHLFSAERRLGPLRIGLFCLTIAACFIAFQLHAIAVPPTDPGGSAAVWLGKAGAGLLVPLVYLRELRRLTRARVLAVVAASVLLALLTSIG